MRSNKNSKAIWRLSQESAETLVAVKHSVLFLFFPQKKAIRKASPIYPLDFVKVKNQAPEQKENARRAHGD
jgi:hypothetical protein